MIKRIINAFNVLHFAIKPLHFIKTTKGKTKLKEWAKKVYKKNNYRCQRCNYKAWTSTKTIHAHHIKPKGINPRLAYHVSNGITLCETCHKQFHKKYGNKNGSASVLRGFLRGGK